jgi:restriction system protein
MGDPRLLGGVAEPFAWMIAGALAFLAVVAGVVQHRARQLLEQQTGLESIRNLTWQAFERLVAEAYRRQGYSVSEVADGGADGGIDIVLKKDGTVLVQCKHWKVYRVGVREVRELFGVVCAERATTGVLITSGQFTQEARDFAAGKPLELVDGDALLKLLRAGQGRERITSPVGVTTSPGPATVATPPRCPRCGRSMTVRTATRGPRAGQQFWGCSGFPGCRATLQTGIGYA